MTSVPSFSRSPVPVIVAGAPEQVVAKPSRTTTSYSSVPEPTMSMVCEEPSVSVDSQTPTNGAGAGGGAAVSTVSEVVDGAGVGTTVSVWTLSGSWATVTASS